MGAAQSTGTDTQHLFTSVTLSHSLTIIQTLSNYNRIAWNKKNWTTGALQPDGRETQFFLELIEHGVTTAKLFNN